MKIVLAFDSFKESMRAYEACQAAEKGILATDATVECISFPLADGGEGSMEAILHSCHGEIVTVDSFDSFKQPQSCQIGIVDQRAILEMAQTCGLESVPFKMRNPWLASSYGYGKMVLHALDLNYRDLVFCLGGSATNDGGIGMLEALGVKFFDQKDNLIEARMQNALAIKRVDISNIDPRIYECNIIIASDVRNPLLAEKGATYVFGLQKGLQIEDCEAMEACMEHIANLLEAAFKKTCRHQPGSGAAGGVGFCLQLVGGKITSGVDYILDLIKLDENIRDADYVFTGEGSFDTQTKYGKTPIGVAKRAKQYGVPTIALVGRNAIETKEVTELGIHAIFSIVQEATSLEQALISGKDNLSKTSENIMRLLKGV